MVEVFLPAEEQVEGAGGGGGGKGMGESGICRLLNPILAVSCTVHSTTPLCYAMSGTNSLSNFLFQCGQSKGNRAARSS